jgi:hypothetical protein
LCVGQKSGHPCASTGYKGVVIVTGIPAVSVGYITVIQQLPLITLSQWYSLKIYKEPKMKRIKLF